MSALQLEPVRGRRALREFIDLPYRLYKNHPHWVPPLRMEEKKTYSARRNPLFGHCEVEHFLLRDGRRVIGRISPFINHRAITHWGDKVGMYGAYECVNSPEAAAVLLAGAEAWLKERGMRVVQGPWSFASQEFGLLVEGFETPPMVMAPYHPPYYDGQMTAAGLAKAKDLLVYELNAPDFSLPHGYAAFADRVAARHGVTLRPIRMNRLTEDVRALVSVANRSTEGNWGYIPVTDEEADDLASGLKSIADPELVLLAEVGGEAVGYLIALPDINLFFRGGSGRLTPRLLWKLAFRRRAIDEYRIWALGVVPEFQRKGLDTLFYRWLHEKLVAKGARRIEANYILEDNMPMNNPLLKMGFKICKRYRVYEKVL